jgi:hypothetical protein
MVGNEAIPPTRPQAGSVAGIGVSERSREILLIDHAAPKTVAGVERVWIFRSDESADHAAAPIRSDQEVDVEASLRGDGCGMAILRANADQCMVW